MKQKISNDDDDQLIIELLKTTTPVFRYTYSEVMIRYDWRERVVGIIRWHPYTTYRHLTHVLTDTRRTATGGTVLGSVVVS